MCKKADEDDTDGEEDLIDFCLHLLKSLEESVLFLNQGKKKKKKKKKRVNCEGESFGYMSNK